jgi:hypothetical protein
LVALMPALVVLPPVASLLLPPGVLLPLPLTTASPPLAPLPPATGEATTSQLHLVCH